MRGTQGSEILQNVVCHSDSEIIFVSDRMIDAVLCLHHLDITASWGWQREILMAISKVEVSASISFIA